MTNSSNLTHPVTLSDKKIWITQFCINVPQGKNLSYQNRRTLQLKPLKLKIPLQQTPACATSFRWQRNCFPCKQTWKDESMEKEGSDNHSAWSLPQLPNDSVSPEPSCRIKMSHNSVSNPGNSSKALADQHKARFICCGQLHCSKKNQSTSSIVSPTFRGAANTKNFFKSLLTGFPARTGLNTGS